MENKVSIIGLIRFLKEKFLKITVLFFIIFFLILFLSLSKGCIYQTNIPIIVNKTDQKLINDSSFLEVPTLKEIFSKSVVNEKFKPIVTVDRESRVFNVYINNTSKEKLITQTNLYIKNVKKILPKIYNDSRAKILVDQNKFEIKVVSPRLLINIIVSIIISLQIVFIYAIYSFYKNNNITKEEIENFNISIFGEIPKL